MTEQEAQAWIADRFGATGVDRVGAFLERVIEENSAQNLISPASVGNIWTRHALDSAQLLAMAPADWSIWLDVGTGGGFPGMVVALLAIDREVILVEPRNRRAIFLADCARDFRAERVQVEKRKVQAVPDKADVISARAVAQVGKVLRDAAHCAKADTIWLLPRGRSGLDELGTDNAMFHVEHSLTDPQSVILIGRGIPR